MRTSLLGALALLVFELAACGATTPSTSSSSGSSTSSVSATACALRDLVVTRVGDDAGLGNRAVYFEVENRGASTCTLEGYPSIAFEIENGAAMAVNVQDANGSYFSPAAPIQPVALASQQRAHFEVTYFGPSASCPTSSCMRVAFAGIAGDTFVVVAIQACATDTLHVGPLRAGRRTP
jgi:hypothetical protein